jgi:hypothetical protein
MESILPARKPAFDLLALCEVISPGRVFPEPVASGGIEAAHCQKAQGHDTILIFNQTTEYEDLHLPRML